jgi:hypothetical protein
VRDRLHKALSIIYGIEPWVLLKEIWGAPEREIEQVALWMADALIDAALRDASTVKRPPAPPKTTKQAARPNR